MKPAARTALEALKTHWAELGPRHLRDLFADDPDRAERFSRRLGDLTVDFSKTRLDGPALDLLVRLAEAAEVEALRDAMFAGEAINPTERRAVLHVALRNRSNRPIRVGGEDVMPAVNAVLAAMRDFSTRVREGALRGATGKPFTDVVNIGIGGSDLGPAMATIALSPYYGGGPRLHFVSNVDGAQIADTLAGLDPAATLFLVASKTFTTQETLTNAHTARTWLVAVLGEAAVGDHFAALSTNAGKVAEFGIAADRMFGFWDWVGGRYSVWSAIGMPLAIAVGFDHFEAFLDGAHAMDEHFRSAPLAENLPVLLGLIGVWHRNVCGWPTHAILPYDQRLSRFAAHLQQLEMESNGKRVTRGGAAADTATGPVIWGEPGTNGQHTFFQLLHQGSDIVPCDFLLAATPHEALSDHHAKLAANCLAQSQALAFGRSEDEARAAMRAAGLAAAEIDRLAPHRAFPGNRPSTTMLYRLLDPATLGMLVALYEHKVFVQGAIWDINPFDQWGVELGKELADSLLPVVSGEGEAGTVVLDASTAALVKRFRELAGG